MKILNSSNPILTLACCVLTMACLPMASRASNLTANTSQGSGASWTNVIWKTNGTGTAVGPPVPGNTYMFLSNAIPFGNNLGNARTRNPLASATSTITFLGDSLTMTTNTEIRTKNITSGATGAPILNFPGAGGNPGLILNGGVLNVGDDGVPAFAGKIQVTGTSILCPGDNGAGTTLRPNRAITISGQLSGSGNLVILQTPTNIAQTISGTGNTFSGQWFVKAGRLLGATPGSLGTNSITVDPLLFPPPPINPTVAATNAWFNGPAVLEANYTLNSAGVLTLTNGGLMRLHASTVFTAAYIEGTPLGAGTHFFPELSANFPNNFDPGGFGAITIQPFGTPPLLPPSIIAQPLPQETYAGKTSHFSVTASDNGFPPLTYQWRRDGTNLTDAGNIAGSTNAVLAVSSVSAADVVGYDVVVVNTSGSVTSTVATLTLATPTGEAYETAVLAAGPVAFYQLNETGNPASGNLEAFDFVGGYAGTYGNTVLNGINGVAGPRPTDGFSGFGAGNSAAQFLNPPAASGSKISVLPWKLNTNTVTITAWINPSAVETANNGLVYCRGGTTVAGLGYNTVGTLVYNWNNEQPTYGWSSGLIPPLNQWSLVALVVTPTNATIYVFNASGLQASSHVYTHVNQGFDGTTLIGDDSFDGGNGGRAFNGIIDDVAVFNQALSEGQLLALYSAASGISVSSFPPSIAIPPASTNVYQGQTAQFTGLATGTEPLSYQWQAGATGTGTYTNLTDGGQFSGSTTPTLTISGIDLPNDADYVVTVNNSAGATNSTPPATLTVLMTNPPQNITITNQQGTGLDWDTAGATTSWLDGLGATTSAAAKPGSTYEVLPGARLRSPQDPITAAFPGNKLTVDGDGIWNLNPGAGATIGEFRFKQPTYGVVNGAVNFKKLVMNGGQIDAGNDNLLIVGGEIDILTNTPFNNDGGNDRGYRLDARLTGSGNVEYHGYNQASFMTTYSNNLNIACTSNTFSGMWNVVTGTLLGTGTNSLGTNHIIVGANAALETTYNIKNTEGYLVLNGRMFLHQNDTFRSVVVNGKSLGTPIAPTNYTYDVLQTMFPANFTYTWNQQNGVTNTALSGSITVLASAGPLITAQPQSLTRDGQQSAQFQVSAVGGLPLVYQWRAGAIGSGVYTNLADAGNISGSTNTALNITNVNAGNYLDYIVVVTNAFGAATSSVARLTVISVPIITVQPLPQTLYGQQSAQFRISALGDLPLVYQWQAGVIGSGVYTNLADAGNISGSTTTNLTVTNVVAANGLDYIVVVTNTFGAATSSVATLTINPEPLITLELPASLTLYEQQTAQFQVGVVGLLPMSLQWQAGPTGFNSFTNLTDGGKFSGTTTTNMTITNVGMENAGDYIFNATNAGGGVVSTIVTVTVLPISPPENLTLNFGGAPIQQAQGTSWDSVNNWSDGQAASVSAVQKPGSTYEVVPGARLRTPTNNADVTFPGNQLTVDGDGVWVNNNGATIGELRFKHNSAGTVHFKKLVMNGGQLDAGDNTPVVIAGEIDILTNTPIYVDSSAAQDRAYQIDAWLTGSGNIEWHQFGTSFAANLNITGTSNTFSGKWHVVQGPLLGSGANSLGTNAITVDAGGALETLYDVNSPGADLVLNGQMFLHQNDTFRSALVGGAALTSGTHSFAQLSAAYPANFPATWPQQAGSTISAGSGSLTVTGPPPGFLFFHFSGGNLQLTWSPGLLLEADQVTGPWTTNATATSPFTILPTAPQKFYRVLVQ